MRNGSAVYWRAMIGQRARTGRIMSRKKNTVTPKLDQLQLVSTETRKRERGNVSDNRKG